jgi:hypothetical protein
VFSSDLAARPSLGSAAAITSPILVLGDAMADWLAYGLEAAYSDTPDMTVARKFRGGSSLIYNEPGRGPRSRQFDWAAHAKELLAKDNASVVVMMIGLADRVSIREPKPPAPPANQKKPGGKADAKPDPKAAATIERKPLVEELRAGRHGKQARRQRRGKGPDQDAIHESPGGGFHVAGFTTENMTGEGHEGAGAQRSGRVR